MGKRGGLNDKKKKSCRLRCCQNDSRPTDAGKKQADMAELR